MNSARTDLSPARLVRNGFDWSGKTARLPYIIIALSTLILASFIPVTRNFTGANTVVFVALTMLLPIWLGHTRRRLRDVGWSGWLMWVAVLPVLSLLLTIFLAFKPGDPLDEDTTGTYSRWGFALALACAALILSRAFWAPYWIPAGSMKPTFLVGDFVAVVPLTNPRRGDVLVFQHPAGEQEHISRLIGMPGDEIRLIAGIVHINGQPMIQIPAGEFTEPYKRQGALAAYPRCMNAPTGEGAICTKRQFLESTPEAREYSILDIEPQAMDDTPPVIVPEDHYYFLGDNRDNAMDSRFSKAQGGMGTVPRENLIGRAAMVLFSSSGDSLLHVWTWRGERFFLRVE